MSAHSIARPSFGRRGTCSRRNTCLGYTSTPKQPKRDLLSGRAPNFLHLLRFVCPKSVAKDFEQPCFALAAGSAKGINRRADADIDKPTLLKHMLPACTRQATSNSVSPQVDITQRPRRNLLAVCNVCKLQTPARFQDAHDLREDPTLVGA